MGYYIQTDAAGGKAAYLVANHAAKIISEPPAVLPSDRAVICVVDNGIFDAAGYCYGQRELEAFARADQRPRTWLLMDLAVARKLSGYEDRD